MALNLSGCGEAIVRRLLGAPNRSLSRPSDWRYGTHGSLSVDVKNGCWFDHEAGEGGGLIDLVCRERGGSNADAANWLESEGLISGSGRDAKPSTKRHKPDDRKIETAYDYVSSDGELIFQVVRLAPKGFRQRRPDGRGGWSWSVKGVTPVLYRLPQLLAADQREPVFVVEGEKDCDRLASLGFVATTSAGGAGKWADRYAETLAGRRVVIVPDNDTAGHKHAQTVAASLQRHAAAVTILRLSGVPEKGDISDWLDAGGTTEELRAQADTLLRQSEGRSGPPPTPLFRPMDEATEPPRAALGAFRAAAEAVETLTQAPFALAMQSVLATGSLTVQHHCDVETLGPDAPLSLAFISIAKSGERKSACDRLALRAVREVERARIANFAASMTAHSDRMSMRAAERQTAIKSKDHEALEALGADPAPPLAPNILFSEPTLEGVLRHFDEGQPSIGIFSDEGGQLFGGHAMNRDNRLRTAASLSKFWDGAPLDRVRASAPPTVYYGRRVALHLMLQPDIADRVLADPTLRDQGLLSRTLIARPESRIGTRLIPVGEDKAAFLQQRQQAKAELDAFDRRVTSLLASDPSGNTPRELAPRCLELSPDARALLIEFANAVEADQRSGERLEAIQGFASKVPQQTARLAAVMTIFADETAAAVELDAMTDAIKLMTWYIGEAQRLFDTGPVGADTCEADILRRWLVERFKDAEFDVRTIVRCGPSTIRDTGLVRRLIPILEENGWVVPVDCGARGRRTARWRVNRP